MTVATITKQRAEQLLNANDTRTEEKPVVFEGQVTMNDIVVLMPNLPTSNPAVAGQLWSNAGVLTVSAG